MTAAVFWVSDMDVYFYEGLKIIAVYENWCYIYICIKEYNKQKTIKNSINKQKTIDKNKKWIYN